MLLKAAAAALVLALSTPAFAQDPTPIDAAILTCVGPGYTPDGDPFEVLDSLDPRSCTRVCRASAMGCKAVVKAIDKCGVNFLKAAARVGIEICRGWGYTAQECRGINAEAKSDIDWWRAQGRIERDECDSEVDDLCLSRCQSASRSALYEDLVPAPLPERPQPEAGSAIVYLDKTAILSPPPVADAPQAGEGARVIAVPAGTETIIRGEVVVPPQRLGGVIESTIFRESDITSRFSEIEPLLVREQAEYVLEEREE